MTSADKYQRIQYVVLRQMEGIVYLQSIFLFSPFPLLLQNLWHVLYANIWI